MVSVFCKEGGAFGEVKNYFKKHIQIIEGFSGRSVFSACCLSDVHSVTHSLKHILSLCCVAGAAPGAGNRALARADTATSNGVHGRVGERDVDKISTCGLPWWRSG